jgi:hypothetical protein
MTTVKEIFFDEDRFSRESELFPKFISEDDWIIYHGTSSICENAIERKGFLPDTNAVTKEEIQAVVSIYEKMNWCGNHGGGYVVLSPFSLKHDFGDPRGKPVYFAESSYRASLYSMRDYCAGECAMALRHAFDDLYEYLESPVLREQHNKQLRLDFGYLQYDKELYRKAVIPVDLRWLKEELDKIESLRLSCQELYDRHVHGVVYAVRFSETDAETLEYHVSMGIKSFNTVSPEHIVAKVTLPLDFPWAPYRQDNKRLNVVFNKPGLFAML